MASAGIFYSLMVLSLLAPIVFYIISYMGAIQTQGEQMTVKFEGIELANYADSIALDVPRVLEIASKRAIVAVIDYSDTNGVGVNDSEGELQSLVLNNSFSNTQEAPIMLNSSFANWINSTQQIGQNHGFVANITVRNLRINYTDPFTVNFSIELYANITDRIGSMRLERAYNATTVVPIEGFTDPIYPLNTRGLVERTIRKANMTINTTTAVSLMINNSWYVNNSDAPSFLERLQGCTYPLDAAHHCSGKYPNMGIESFVYLPELINHTCTGSLCPQVKPNATMVDHMYFNATTGTPPYVPGYNVTGVTNVAYDWFRMDPIHNNTYVVRICGPSLSPPVSCP
jgi:hypothetical protein